MAQSFKGSRARLAQRHFADPCAGRRQALSALINATTPIVLMGYANPIECYDLHHGAGSFVRDAKAVRVDGVLVVDYPPEECQEFAVRMKAADLAPIFLLAPTSTEKRMAEVGKIAAGYVYYVSLKGVTGQGTWTRLLWLIWCRASKPHVNTPVGVGFGIRDAETAKAVAAVSDAVVIGSRICAVA